MRKEIKTLPTVGEKTEKKLEKLGLKTINDLIFHFPYRYERYNTCSNLNKIEINTPVNIKVRIDLIRNRRSFKRKMTITEAIVSDDHGSLEVIWFNQPFIAKNLQNGDLVSLAGKIKLSGGRLIMSSPVYEKIVENKDTIHTEGIVPVYKTTYGLTQKQLRFLIKQSSKYFKKVKEYLPEETLKRQGLQGINTSLEEIHFPEKEDSVNKAINYFKFLELFLFQAKSAFLRKDIERKEATSLKIKIDDIKGFLDSLPFELSDDQKKSVWEILKDTELDRPMYRLLQGDVGSGKTIVALVAIFNCILNKSQATFMVPAEILAMQHYKSSLEFFKDYNFKIALLTSQKREANFEIPVKRKKDVSKYICQNADLIIGTHSLIQEDVNFKNLGLVVVDEQHRFGVSQRQEVLKNDKRAPHFLSMTATPIPRSLSLVLLNGVKISNIKTKPKDRLDVKTDIVGPDRKRAMYEFIEKEIEAGGQAFIICPLIEESDNNSELKSVKAEYERLQNNIFPNIKMDILHGRMKAKDKEAVMNSFLENETKIIIATSVIEVGIDVKNATIMLIEGVERFGLAQLHQFRGRVGRGDKQSYCFLSVEKLEGQAMKRLEALKKYNNGLDLALVDLKNRGAGDIYGKIQSGFDNFKFASFFDSEIIQRTKKELEILDLEKYPDLIEKIQRNLEESHLE